MDSAQTPPSDSPGLRRFPDGFTWGLGTSAYQIEGSLEADGRGPSIWEQFKRNDGAVYDGNRFDPACDSYRRWDDDVRLLVGAGVGAYRFSFAWPRMLPEGVGQVNEAGVAFYDRAIDTLLEAGIEPVPTLYHWDLPLALHERGGWESREIVDWFAEYAALAADRFGDRLGRVWVLNEPNYHAWLGYRLGTNAPGHMSHDAFMRCMHHQNLVTASAAAVLRASRPALRVGTVITLQHCRPVTDDPADIEAGRLMDLYINRGFLDPVLLGRCPTEVQADLERIGAWRDGDDTAAHADLDFLGVNFYGPFFAKANHEIGFELARPTGGVAVTPIGLPDEPEDLYDVLAELRDEYGNPEVMISEIGTAEWVGAKPGGQSHDDRVQLDDQYRIDFYRRHFAEVHRAIGDGCNCTGVFAWSLLDNIEWEYGWAVRFGLVKVDSATGERTPKASYRWLAELARSNHLSWVE